MKILLLEDDPILQEIIEEFLLEQGHKVTSFYDGEKALDAIGECRYDLLLLDVNVPNIDGFEILSYLRDIGNTTPAIYITSLAGVEDLKKGLPWVRMIISRSLLSWKSCRQGSIISERSISFRMRLSSM